RLRRSRRRMAALELVARDDSVRDQQFDEAREPALVIAHSQIFGRRQELDLMTRVVQILLSAARPHHACDGVNPSVPRFVTDGLVSFVMDRSHAVHAAHVVHAVHAMSPACSSVILAVPTIESRVTRAASAFSLMFSLPAGRSGSTR